MRRGKERGGGERRGEEGRERGEGKGEGRSEEMERVVDWKGGLMEHSNNTAKYSMIMQFSYWVSDDKNHP